jgi:hypothetical protein
MRRKEVMRIVPIGVSHWHTVLFRPYGSSVR